MNEFEKLVQSMRTAQKAYFRRRTPGALESSKELEKQVDEALKERQNKTGKLDFGDTE